MEMICLSRKLLSGQCRWSPKEIYYSQTRSFVWPDLLAPNWGTGALRSRAGGFTTEQISIAAGSRGRSRLAVSWRWRAGACVSTLASDSQAGMSRQTLRTGCVSHLCSQTIKRACPGQPSDLRLGPRGGLGIYAGHFGNGLWLNKAYNKV